MEEGATITLTATANRVVLAGEDATVRLTLVAPVVDPAPSSVTIVVGATNGSAVVTVVDDLREVLVEGAIAGLPDHPRPRLPCRCPHRCGPVWAASHACGPLAAPTTSPKRIPDGAVDPVPDLLRHPS